MTTISIDKRLIYWGAVLFLIGLLQGALIPYFLNSRMALSAHLAAVQSGMALMIFGLIWQHIKLEQRWQTITYYSSILGMYLVWVAITLAAILGASKALPIAGKGYSATQAGEMSIEIIVTIGAVFGVVSAVLIVVGLYRGLRSDE